MFRLFVICSISIVWSVKGQQLLGSYSVVHEGIGSSETLYRFYDDGTFVYQSWDDVGDYFGSGTFVLGNKQITFQFLPIPAALRNETIFSVANNDTCSTLRVFNPLIPKEDLEFSFQIMLQDSVLRSGDSNALGIGTFQLHPREKMIVYIQSANPLSPFFYFSKFTIASSDRPKNYLISTHGLKNYARFVNKKRVSYPIKLKKKGTAFLLKEHQEWVRYSRID